MMGLFIRVFETQKLQVEYLQRIFYSSYKIYSFVTQNNARTKMNYYETYLISISSLFLDHKKTMDAIPRFSIEKFAERVRRLVLKHRCTFDQYQDVVDIFEDL